MNNQFEALVKMQLSMCEGWAKLLQSGFSMYEALIVNQAKMFQHPAYFRYKDIIPQGADLLDHYGKRNHDVDVEKV